MRSKLSLVAALAIGLAATELAVAVGPVKSSAAGVAAKTIASCCSDCPCCPDCCGSSDCPCCFQMADSMTAQCDCPFCSGQATAAKASCCPNGDCCPNGACCQGTVMAKATKK